MKRLCCIVILVLIGCTKLIAQGNELLLAKQYSNNGETDKALAIYQKLYAQNNEYYYTDYVAALISAKKFNEAESITKKIMRKYPTARKYTITLGSIYTQQSDTLKANELYDALIKGLPADQSEIAILATQFYQANNTNYAIKTFLQGRKTLRNEALFSNELITLYRNKRDKVSLTNEFLNFLPIN